MLNIRQYNQFLTGQEQVIELNLQIDQIHALSI